MPAFIRLATTEDTSAIHSIYTPYCLTPISFEAEPPGESAMRQRIEKTLATAPWLVCELDGDILGYAYASPHGERAAYRWSVNTSVYIQPRRTRSGIGRALYVVLFELLRLQGYVNAYAGITLPNAASTGLHESLGFRLVGMYPQVGFKYGVWHDVVWYGLQLQSPPSLPESPKPLASIVGSAEIDQSIAAGLALLRL